VLHEGAVPHETEEESADENVKHEDEELGEHFGFGLSLGNFLDHLLHMDIFFSRQTTNERTASEWIRK